MIRIILSHFGLLLILSGALHAATPLPPNILFLFADDWGYLSDSHWAGQGVKTPAFDRIAKEGVLFRNAHSAAPSCSPSRAAILTGQWPWRLEQGANLRGHIPVKFDVYPDLLEKAGYTIGLTGKGYGPGSNEGRPHNAAGPAFKNFDAFLAARPQGKPFCFWFGSHQPHRPYTPGSGMKFGIDPAKVFVPPYLPDNEITRSDICDYLQQVELFDQQCAAILDALEKAGELDNTLIVVTGDNGYPMRTLLTKDFHYIRNFKPERWPAGDPPREPLPAFEKIAADTYAAFSDCDSGPLKAFLVTRRDDPVVKPFADRVFGKRPARELYDLRHDPFEIKNVAEDPAYADIGRDLDARLMAELKATADPRASGGGEKFDRYPVSGQTEIPKPERPSAKSKPAPR